MTILEVDNAQGEQNRTINIPQNRVSPLKKDWKSIISSVVNDCKLDIRYNIGQRCVELRTNKTTTDPEIIEKANAMIQAFAKGFDLKDAKAFLTIDQLMIDTFDVTNVKLILQGDHLSRAVGRIAGAGGKVKHTIENATKTRIVLADKTVHIMGTAGCVKVARDAVCDLILGSDPAKVYQRLRVIAGRFGVE